MRKLNYLVSVFVKDKCVDMFYSENLCELHVCRLLHPGCEMEVFDVRDFHQLSNEKVKMYEREGIYKAEKNIIPSQIYCQETKRIYPSMSACAKDIMVSRETLVMAIKDYLPINGRHYLFTKDLFKRRK